MRHPIVLDGLTFTDGPASAAPSDREGGGMAGFVGVALTVTERRR